MHWLDATRVVCWRWWCGLQLCVPCGAHFPSIINQRGGEVAGCRGQLTHSLTYTRASACCIICCSERAQRVPRQPLTCSIIMRVLRGKSGAETLKKHEERALAHAIAKGSRAPSPGKSQTLEKNVIDRISGSPEVKGCSWFEYTLTEHHQLSAPCTCCQWDQHFCAGSAIQIFIYSWSPATWVH